MKATLFTICAALIIISGIAVYLIWQEVPLLEGVAAILGTLAIGRRHA